MRSAVKDAAGRVAVFTYSGGLLTKITDSAGRAIVYTYANGRLATSADADGKTTTYGYDSAARLSAVTTTRGVKVTVGYDSAGRVATVTRYTDLNGGGQGQATTFAYPSTTSTTQTNAAGKTWTYTRDAAGRVTKVSDPLGRARSRTWTANSSVATATDAMGAGGTGGNVVTYSYDAANNPTQVEMPTGAITSAVYTTGGACGSTDAANPDLPKCVTDDAGNKAAMTYDTLGNLVARADTTAGSGGAKTEYTRQRAAGATSGPDCGGKPGQMCAAKDPNGNVTSYRYDADGNLIEATPPAPLGKRTWTYDSLGRVTSSTNGRGQKLTHTYDAQDRLLSTSVPASDAGPAYTKYFSWDADGNMTFNDGAVISFDAQNRQDWVKDASGASAGSQGYSVWYDEAGNAHPSNQNVAFDAANQVTSIGKAGVNCTNDATSQAGCVKIGYDSNGAETSRTLPGGVVQTITRDGSGRPIRMTVKRGSTVLSDLGYSYTKPGTSGKAGDRSNVQTSTDYTVAGGVVPAGAVTAYGYDSLNRVTSVVEKTAAGAASAGWTYAYDKAGNRTQQVRSGATGVENGTTSYGYNAAHELTSVNSSTSNLAYDADGNETKAAGWDWVNVPRRESRTTANGDVTSMTTHSEDGSTNDLGFSYGGVNPGQDDRLMSAHGNTHFSSPVGLARTQGADGNATDYLLSPSGQAVAYTRPAGTGYYLRDRLGSVIAITDDFGALVTTYRYDPYGNIRTAAGQDNDLAWSNRLLYAGGLLDTATGLYRFGIRWYDPNTGRFTTPDPTSQERNPYLYAGGNPCNKTDPTGAVNGWKCALGTGGGAITGAIAGAGVASIPTLGVGAGVGAAVAAAGGAMSGAAASCFD